MRARCIFWPGGKVSVECDVYFGSSAQLEGEEESLIIPNVGSEQPVTPHIHETPSPEHVEKPLPIESSREENETPTPPTLAQANDESAPPTGLRRSTRNRKPSRPVCNLLSGMGSTDPSIACGLQIPGTFAEDPEEER